MRRPFHLSSRLLSSSALFAVFVAFSTPSLAQMVTDDTEMVGAGGSELEISYGRDRTRAGGVTEREHSIPITYTYGLSDTIDISVDIAHSRIRVPGGIGDIDDPDNPDNNIGSTRVKGFGNTVIGLKWRFFDNEDSGTSLAIAPEIAIPVSSRREDDGLGTGKTSGNLNFILSQEVPFGSVHFNAGWGRERYRHADDNATTRHFSVAPVWEISDQWQLSFDTGVEVSRSGGDTVRSKFAAASVLYSPSENIDLQLGYMRKTSDESPKAKTHSVEAVLTWRF
jgi:hypothetical protein